MSRYSLTQATSTQATSTQATSTQATATTTNQLPNQQTRHESTMMGATALAVPLILILSIIAFRKYRVFMLRRQIETLEKLWQMDFKERTP